ncbi:MAG: thioredoxin fold domain-containing protein [Deferrisomatales bacterium]
MRRVLPLVSAVALFLSALAASPATAAADPLGDEARHARKPLIVDFGMTRCLQCIEQGKTMDELKAAIGDRVLLKFVHVGQEEALAEAYKVLLIPTLVFFDARGTEVFRNVGQMKKEPMLAKARELRFID